MKSATRVTCVGSTSSHYLTGFDKLDAKINVLLLLEHGARKDEVSSIEAGQMAGFLDDRLAVESGQEGKVGARRWVGGKVLDGAVCGRNPSSHRQPCHQPCVILESCLPVLVFREACWIVDEHLDQVLVEAVITTVPTAAGIHKHAGVDINVGSNQSWKWLGERRLRVQQVALQDSLAIARIQWNYDSEHTSAFCVRFAYVSSPVRSESLVHSNTSEPAVASPFVVDPSVLWLLKYRLFEGMPVGVSKA